MQPLVLATYLALVFAVAGQAFHVQQVAPGKQENLQARDVPNCGDIAQDTALGRRAACLRHGSGARGLVDQAASRIPFAAERRSRHSRVDIVNAGNMVSDTTAAPRMPNNTMMPTPR